MNKCKTIYAEKIIDESESLALFFYIKENVVWEHGIKSKNGFTRKAKSIDLQEFPEIQREIIHCLSNMTITNYCIHGVYLNFYETGEMYTPNHSHPRTHQLVISLGGTRTLNVGKKQYQMKNGDAILFGSSIHGVPKENTTEQRISIATFMSPLPS